MQKNWRKMLTELGGWDNELLSVPAGAVREIIEEVEALRESASVHATIIAAKDGEIAALTAEVTHMAEKLTERDAGVDRNSAIADEISCKHRGTTTAHWDFLTCDNCGAYKTDSDKSAWGIAADQWFPSKEIAQFYKANGRLPDPIGVTPTAAPQPYAGRLRYWKTLRKPAWWSPG